MVGICFSNGDFITMSSDSIGRLTGISGTETVATFADVFLLGIAAPFLFKQWFLFSVVYRIHYRGIIVRSDKKRRKGQSFHAFFTCEDYNTFMRILLVEDEPKLNQSLKAGLTHKGFAVDSALDGTQGQDLAESETYDLIILDVLLPSLDGYQVCRNLRSEGISTPILFLTAKDSLEEKVMGLEAGGDDYLVKPFEFKELVARIRALLRRPRSVLPGVLEQGALRLDPAKQEVLLDQAVIPMTLREFQLLEYFMRNVTRVLTRDELLDHVWDREGYTLSNTVDVHIKNLRQKLGKYGKHLETVRGVGYRLAP
jgi:DNA-binding response OmpR family regulator